MWRSHLSLLLVAAVLTAAACNDQSVGPTMEPENQSPSLSVIPAGAPLAVQIQGQGKARWEIDLPIKATVSGGTGPFHYTWQTYVCFDEGTRCYGPSTRVSGIGVDSINFLVYQEMWSVEIHVSVEDTHGTDVSGSASHLIEGPPSTDAPREGDGPNPGFKRHCNENPTYFPFHAWAHAQQVDDEDHRDYYARNWCTGERIYNKCNHSAFGGICPEMID